MKPGDKVLKSLIKECGGLIVDDCESCDEKFKIISDKDETLSEKMQVVTSDYILSAINSTSK